MSASLISAAIAVVCIATRDESAFVHEPVKEHQTYPLRLVVPPHLAKAPRSAPIASGDWRTQSHLKTVGVRVYVLADGTVGDAKVVVPSTFPSADNAAVKLVRNRWKYTPDTIAGHATGMWTFNSVSFPYNTSGGYVDRSSEFKAQSLAYGEYLYTLEHQAEQSVTPKP